LGKNKGEGKEERIEKGAGIGFDMVDNIRSLMPVS
jgi:hypothetical protein